MKAVEINQKSKEELEKMVQDGKEKLRQLRFDLAAGKVKNIRQIRLIKKDIARMFTKLNKQETK
jgi:large subunit ribosomal protein L29